MAFIPNKMAKKINDAIHTIKVVCLLLIGHKPLVML